ncbi:MAG: PRC-barrel domain-containing protein [Candidatus Eiseniibacteriota bacterium]
MSRKLALAGVSAVVLALATPSLAADKDGSATRPTSPITRQTTQIDAHKIIGHAIVNADDDKIGSIDSVMLGRNGSVQAVVVNVGGFLGLGERNVAIDWADIQVSPDGKKITTALTKKRLEALPEFHYAADTARGTAFTAPAGTARRDRAEAGKPADKPEATKDGPTIDTSSLLAYKSSAIVGAKAVNVRDENVGEVKELLIGANGLVRGALISVGGFLGIGERNVVVDWRDLSISQDGKDVRVLVKLSKDQLKALPEYTERS